MLRIVTANGERRHIALRILHSDRTLEEQQRCVAEAESLADRGELDLSHLLLAERNGQPVGALWLSVQPDKTGLLWPPRVIPLLDGSHCDARSFARSTAIEDALLQAAIGRLDANDAWIGHALLELDQVEAREALERNGIPRMSELRFLEMRLDTDSPESCESSHASVVTYHKSRNRLRFSNVIEQTYRGSLDCPELNSARDARQSLQSHELAGTFTSEMWRLYQVNGVDAGVILMSRQSRSGSAADWEVLYLGVVEPFRRRGLGRTMMLDGVRLAREANVPCLHVVVDARNEPAAKLYERLGFRERVRRVAHARLRPRGHQQVLHNKPDG